MRRREWPARLGTVAALTVIMCVPTAATGAGPSPAGWPCAPTPVVEVVLPATAYAGGTAVATYTVRNAGGQTARGVRLTLRLPAGLPATIVSSNCLLSAGGCDLDPGAVMTVRVALTPKAATQATVGGDVTTTSPDANLARAFARTALVVKQPRVELVPPLGPPGFVTSAHGVDFPPGAAVGLTWRPGVTAQQGRVTVAADGSFVAQMPVVRSDRPGARVLTVSPATGAAFSPATTAFLVVPHSLQPPRFVDR